MTHREIFDSYCEGYNFSPTVIPPVRRIVAIGDIHGDYLSAIGSLKLAQVINDDLEWIGGDTVVVQIGDQVDRCRPINSGDCYLQYTTLNDEASDIKILNLFTDLDNKARQYGGMVISLLGNHEIMNSQGRLDYVSYLGLEEFNDYRENGIKFTDGASARAYAFGPGHKYGKFLGCTRMTAVIIGTNLFVHAGILPQLMKKYNIKSNNDLEGINKIIMGWLIGIVDFKSVDQILNSAHISPFWPRVFGNVPKNVPFDSEICNTILADTFEIFHINNMIIGHTPQIDGGINFTCGNKIARIDTGSSKAFMNTSNNVQILEILNDNEMKIISN